MSTSLRERRRQLRIQMLRDEILEGAQQLLAEKGYAAMSMDELATRVGVSKPTLYNHFSTKDDLVVAVAVQFLEQLFAQIAAKQAECTTPLQKLAAALRTSVEFQVATEPATLQLWVPDLIRILKSHPTSLAYITRLRESVTELVEAALAAGEINPQLDPPAVVHAFFALSQIPKFIHLVPGCPPDMTRLADTLTHIFCHGLASGNLTQL